jgi:hypothetical protein
MSTLCRLTPMHIIETKLGLYSREIQPIRQLFRCLYFQLHYAPKYRYNICRSRNTLLLSFIRVPKLYQNKKRQNGQDHIKNDNEMQTLLINKALIYKHYNYNYYNYNIDYIVSTNSRARHNFTTPQKVKLEKNTFLRPKNAFFLTFS